MKLGKQLTEPMKTVENYFYGQLSLCTTSHKTFQYTYFCGHEGKGGGPKLSSHTRGYVVERKKISASHLLSSSQLF